MMHHLRNKPFHSYRTMCVYIGIRSSMLKEIAGVTFDIATLARESVPTHTNDIILKLHISCRSFMRRFCFLMVVINCHELLRIL